MAEKLHSAIRWGKPIADLEPFVASDPGLVNFADPKNGNQALHLSCQNGHFEITKWLTAKGADVNGQNGKGQTPLHMSVAYDFLEQTMFLLENGARRDIKNKDGNEAITGIEGDKVGVEAFDGAMGLLRGAYDVDSMKLAFQRLTEQAAIDPGAIDKAVLVQVGMAKKKNVPGWDHKAFMEVMKKY